MLVSCLTQTMQTNGENFMFINSKTFKLPFMLLLAAFLTSFVTASFAMDSTPFTKAKFEQLQSQGKVVLVDVHATWCSTCKKQQKALKTYFEKNPERELHVLQVDFDDQKDIVTMFRAPRQSTFVLYKGNEQVWFSVAETRYDVIEENLEKAFE
jgi:thiol-disulfide isomerase/thioredoxin